MLECGTKCNGTDGKNRLGEDNVWVAAYAKERVSLKGATSTIKLRYSEGIGSRHVGAV